jgi:hypothetical protein
VRPDLEPARRRLQLPISGDLSVGWKAARGFAIVDDEAVIGWQYATVDRENGPALIEAAHGEIAAQMEQIAAVAASPRW